MKAQQSTHAGTKFRCIMPIGHFPTSRKKDFVLSLFLIVSDAKIYDSWFMNKKNNINNYNKYDSAQL